MRETEKASQTDTGERPCEDGGREWSDVPEAKQCRGHHRLKEARTIP